MNYRFVAKTVAMVALASVALWSADEGGTLYKKKCAGCHGPQGEGKPAIKAPTLKGTGLSVDQILERITKGESASKAPHNKGIPGLTEGQAKTIAEHVKALK